MNDTTLMPGPASTDKPATILFVDDEASILSALRRLFRPHGYRILTAESGAAGLDVLAEGPVDLVISDMRMPEMDGAHFLEKVRAQQPEAVRILLTGYSDVTSTINAINKGEIFRYISKPWDDNDIVLIVRDALAQKRLKSENDRLLALTRAQNEELKLLNSGLEDRVKARTAEIEQVNSFLNLANDRLKQNFLVSIKMFSSLMELRENGVGGHARRVADLARRLAIRLKLDAKAQQEIFIAALLHDIGKIGFSDAMLAKPVSKMTSEELQQYRKHPTTGANALMPLTELRHSADLIRKHHERFDGLGFPEGLRGFAIPLSAGILAVANEYDDLQTGALSDKRLSAEDALNTIIQSRGKRYCPDVVDALVDLLGRPAEDARQVHEVPAGKLEPGMVLAHDLLARDGTMLLSADYVLDAAVIREIQGYAEREGVQLELQIRAGKKVG